jgi:hypothetical protein
LRGVTGEATAHVQAKYFGVRGLVVLQIAVGGLAKRCIVAGHVQDVVHDLETQADLIAIIGQSALCFTVGSGKQRAAQN